MYASGKKTLVLFFGSFFTGLKSLFSGAAPAFKEIAKIFGKRDFVIGTVPLTMIIAIILAVILNRKLRARRFYQAAYFMPVVTTIFVTATIFIELLLPVAIFCRVFI